MMQKQILTVFFLLLVLPMASAQKMASGTVFHDLNKNGIKNKGEPPIGRVCVSNGREVVLTDREGRWKLPVGEDTGFFVIKPSGFRPPVNAGMIPQHYYLHKPKGSPPMQVAGVAPTGPLPKSVDFPLWEQKEEEEFSVLLFADTQARGIQEVNYITHDVVEECLGTEAAFGISLGDIVADDPALFAEISGSIAQIGIPWYNIFGNHDFNREASSDQYSDETFERFFGPATFAYEYGKVAFIGLKNIYFNPDGKYKSHFTEQQIDFVRNYLAQVPEDKLVVVLLHAPIISSENREELFRVLENRPFAFSIAGHTHKMAHVFADEKHGWRGSKPHHHFINATVSGSWWCGMKDELGIPHATMNDGAPNGYSILTFNGNQYDIRFKAARRPAAYQMNIFFPDDLAQTALDTAKVTVNVFAGSSRSKVEMQLKGRKEWIPLQHTPMPDPGNLAMYQLSPYLDASVDEVKLDKVFGWKMDPPSVSTHIWQGKLPVDLPPGTHQFIVRTTDMFGKTWTAHRIFRVQEVKQ